MRLTKIYTKTGDQGKTMLASGERVLKTDQRIEAYGTVDELNSFVGLLRDYVRLDSALADHAIAASLTRIQNELFDLGAELATPTEKLNLERQKVVTNAEISVLEEEMDHYNESLKPLKNFILPGGHLCNSSAHIARTVCRRAEREVVRLRQADESVRLETQIYLNRLSDWFFVISRAISHELNVDEVLWDQRSKAKS
ncbi:MAG: cob(I)yrinic acid a,c-diamide adenosyltransferase [Bdellovibrionota bacterium]|nr:MAG: cob(I)yrinic acid a,c-diamide adenosyltransferase [Pseudomonadota bacterium]